MQSESFVFDPRPDFPYLITAKRYWHPQLYSDEVDAVTLICTHGVGFSKEHWEPTLEELYGIQADQRGRHSLKIREAWSIDAPNHGDAAVLNEGSLSKHPDATFSWADYARAIHLILSGLGTGIDVDFWSRKLVGVGHSMGAVALTLANTFAPKSKFDAIVLVEPMMFPPSRPGDACDQLGIELAKTYAACASRRKDIWTDTNDVLKCLRAKHPTKSWDPRVQAVFVIHNARERSDTKGLTLKCSRTQEAASYRDVQSRATASAYLNHLCSITPVHFIYGEHDNLIPKQYQDGLVRSATGGRYASVARVPGAGHCIPQTHPGSLAVALFASLNATVQDVGTSIRCRL